MGSNQEPKKNGPQESHKQGLLEILIIALFGAILTAIGVVLGSLWRGVCHVTKQHFTFDGLTVKERERRIVSGLVVIAILAVAAFSLWRKAFPKWESNLHTTNLRRTDTLPEFPVDSFFVIAESRYVFRSRTSPYRYVRYSGQLDAEQAKHILGKEDECQLVPRGKKLKIFSEKLPVIAVGFQDTLYYYKYSQPASMPASDKAKSIWRTITGSVEDNRYGFPKVGTSDSWDNLERVWSSLPDVDGKKLFWIEALEDENGLICF